MSRKSVSLTKVTVEFKNGEELEEYYSDDLANERFAYLVNLALSVGFSRVRSIRTSKGNHVMFEWRDIRNIERQTNLLNYETNK